MIKHFRTIGVAAAALAASAALIAMPALAQQDDRELAGAPRAQQEYPPLFSGQNNDRDRNRDQNDDRYRDDDRRRAPDFQDAQRDCSRAGNQEAWNRNFYSAQYDGRPRIEYGRRGWELRGRMRLHDRNGYSYVNTACDLRGGRDGAQVEFLR